MSNTDTKADESPWLRNGLGSFTVDVAVPRADATRSDVLRNEWQRQGGGVTPVPEVMLPRRSEGPYAVRIRQKHMADFVLQDMYSDAAAWHCQWQDRIKTVVQLSGQSRFTAGRRTFAVEPGLVSASTSEPEWDSEFVRGSRALVLSLPARDVRFPKNQRLVMTEQNSPPVRLLLAHLRAWAELYDELSPTARWAARSAALELFHGLLSNRVVDDEQVSTALVRATTEYVESRLLDDPDLNPRALAQSLHVSVRTLHRAFTNEDVSVMEYIRQRRLERARSDLASTSLTVSEIAVRWHYSDTSHFIRAYKKRFQELPTARRNLGSG